MKMNKLATILLTTTLTLASGAALAASNSNGAANAAADAGAVAPGAKQNLQASTSADGQHMDKDDIHKNSMCKDGRCPDVNKKVETGNGINNDVDTKTDGTSQ